jgi:DNA polymerase-4
VRDEVGLPLSIGIASTKFLAKIASARAKPDGLLVVPVGTELEFLHPLPVEALWGVGRVTSARLHGLGITTIGELAEAGSLRPQLGRKVSATLSALAWNVDPRPVRGGRRAGSVGSQQALGPGLLDREEMHRVVLGLADRVGRRLRAKGRSASTLTVRVRYPGPRAVTRSHTLPAPTGSTAAINDLGRLLLDRALEAADDEPVTLIGLSMSGITNDSSIQLEMDLDEGSTLRAGSTTDMKRRALDDSIDAVRERFGRDLLHIGETAPVDEDFRRLAERS